MRNWWWPIVSNLTRLISLVRQSEHSYGPRELFSEFFSELFSLARIVQLVAKVQRECLLDHVQRSGRLDLIKGIMSHIPSFSSYRSSTATIPLNDI